MTEYDDGRNNRPERGAEVGTAVGTEAQPSLRDIASAVPTGVDEFGLVFTETHQEGRAAVRANESAFEQGLPLEPESARFRSGERMVMSVSNPEDLDAAPDQPQASPASNRYGAVSDQLAAELMAAADLEGGVGTVGSDTEGLTIVGNRAMSREAVAELLQQ